MPTLTIALSNAGAANRSRAVTVSAAHLTRMINAYRAILGQVPDGAGGMRDRTDAEVYDAWADGLFNGTRANVRSHERVAAAQAAENGVAEIDMPGA